MATEGATQSQEDLIRYLNPLASPQAPEKAFSFNTLSDEIIQILKILLPKTNQKKLSLKLENLSDSSAEALALGLKNSTIENIGLTIKNISATATLCILNAIGSNQHLQKIDIKIPGYYVKDLKTLREFLTKPLSDQAPRQVVAAVEEDLSIALAKDLEEFKLSTAQTFSNVLDRGRSFLTKWVAPTAASISNLLFEEDPDPVPAAAALEQSTEEVRRSPAKPPL